MAIFVIADPHLALGCDKPMDIFAGWKDYIPRLETQWRMLVGPSDTVVLPGDISWAMQLEHCTADFQFLNDLPGQKILGKGNHDYWWTTCSKMESYLQQNNFSSLHFLFNNFYEVGDVALCGTRGWVFDSGDAHDIAMLNRETGRLRASLAAAGEKEKIVFLHYPPFCGYAKADSLFSVMQEYGVRECYYGHQHGPAVQNVRDETIEGIRCRLISADALRFCPLQIR